jgi:hypothetical protein
MVGHRSFLERARATVMGNAPPCAGKVPSRMASLAWQFFRAIALGRSFADLPTGRGLGCPRFGGKYRDGGNEMSERAVRVDQLPWRDGRSRRAAADARIASLQLDGD